MVAQEIKLDVSVSTNILKTAQQIPHKLFVPTKNL